MLDFAIKATERFLMGMPKDDRKLYGQFFTNADTAHFMSDLFSIADSAKRIEVLDPGAGSGLLSIAFIESIQKFSSISEVRLTCYETDKAVLPILRRNLRYAASKSKIPIRFQIRNNNYITSQKLESSGCLERYDYIIANPPYRKIASKSAEALVLPQVCYGTPNLYFLFLSMSILNLKDHGELVYIIPRSWTSGKFFIKFRRFLFDNVHIRRLHLFTSRENLFQHDAILQETVILHARKSQDNNKVLISTSNGTADIGYREPFKVSYDILANRSNNFVYIVSSRYENSIVKKIHRFKFNLISIGLRMKTGITVEFRERQHLANTNTNGGIPLFRACNIQDGRVVFPANAANAFVEGSAERLRQPNQNYLFIKRFSSKEESNRLQCAIYLSAEFPNYLCISTDNKINFIQGKKPLSRRLVYGLYVLFNSSYYNAYFRIFSGTTQVNSDEINQIPVPSLSTIERMGNMLIRRRSLSQSSCDEILSQFFE